jgi:hypothetical protein
MEACSGTAQKLMKADPGRIECNDHGTGFETFICGHLASNPAQEWFSREASEDNLWPDAWCASCNVEFLKEGEWNERNEVGLNVMLLCHRCYEFARSQSTG